MARDPLANNAPNRSQICSVASGGLARIQFDSDRDVLRTAHSRRLVNAICSISRWSCFPSGDPPKKECMSLFIRKEDQRSEDRLLANAWCKDYIGRREKVASRQSVRLESAHGANKTVAKAKWPKSGALLNGPHPKAGSAVTRRRLPLNS
jgi:hypothetical protein